MKELQTILAALAERAGEPAVLATLVAVEGSSYRRPGARLLVRADGSRLGGISGGCLEDDVAERARETLATGRGQLVVYDTTTENDLVWGVGTGCQGVVRVVLERLPAAAPAWVEVLRDNLRRGRATELEVVYGEGVAPAAWGTRLAGAAAEEAKAAAVSAEEVVAAGRKVWRETVEPPVPLVIFGGGDDARPLVRFAKELGWRVTVVDTRPAYATTARFPEADDVVVWPAEVAVRAVAPDRRTLVVVMTHRFRDDVPLLRALLAETEVGYIGVLGARRRTERVLAELAAVAAGGGDLAPAQRARLHAPVGLDLGVATPEGVALAILAEMVAWRSGRAARPLRERAGPIHG